MITYYDIKRLGLILSVQAEIEGMKAENERCKIDNIPLKFGYTDFEDKSLELKNIIYKPEDLL